MKKYFYCQSYQIFNLALRYRMDHDVTVITGAPNIIKACDYLNVSCIKHPEFLGLDFIKKFRQVNSEIDKILKITGNYEIHFSHTQYAIFCFILITAAVKKGRKVIFHDFEFLYNRVDRIPLNKRNSLLLLIYLCMKMRYKIPVQLGMSTPGTYMICLQMNFVDKNINIIRDKNIYYNETLQLFQNIELTTIDIQNLFIAQTFNDDAFFDKNKINEVLRVLNSPDVCIKMHPKIKNNNELKQCKELPDFIPVEYFFKSVKSLVISFHSASLITASKFEKIKVISLLDIVGKKNEFIAKVRNDLITKSNNRIIFPQDITELQLLLNVKSN